MALTAHEFDTIRTIVRDRSAIVLEAGKEYLVESRLQPVAEQLGLSNIAALAAAMRAAPNGPVTNAVVEAMTTNETSFFRDIKPFETLREHVLPELIRSRRGQRTLTIWSAACSTGQEAYSLAIILAESFPELNGWNVRIVGTDISEAVVAQARAASYSQLQVNRGVPAPMLLKYFDRHGMSWQIKPEIRQRVEFRTMNLIATWPVLPTMDLVLMRNVLIYFDNTAREGILRRAHAAMASDGFMMLGSTESTLGINVPFERTVLGPQACYRPAGAPTLGGGSIPTTPRQFHSGLAASASKELR